MHANDFSPARVLALVAAIAASLLVLNAIHDAVTEPGLQSFLVPVNTTGR